jgi:hypothetical protein
MVGQRPYHVRGREIYAILEKMSKGGTIPSEIINIDKI